MTGQERKKDIPAPVSTAYSYVADEEGVLIESDSIKGEPSEVTRIYEEARIERRKVHESIQQLKTTVDLIAIGDVFAQTIKNIPNKSTKRVVLVVEDNPTVGSLYGRMLHDVDFNLEIIQAQSRATAMACVRTLTFDLAILDLRLPDGSGTDVAWEFRARNPKIPILVISGVIAELEAIHKVANRLAPIEIFEKTEILACVRRIVAILGDDAQQVVT